MQNILMQTALNITTAIAVLLFIGAICSWLANRTKVPEILLLIITGMIFGNITYKGAPLIELPEAFLAAIAMVALAMIVFDSTTRLRIKEFDTFSGQALKLMIISVIFNLTIVTIAAHYLLKIPISLSILFAGIISGTSPDVILPISEHIKKIKTTALLKLESIFNTPLTIIIPIMVIDIIGEVQTKIITGIVDQIVPFVMKFIVGIGSGVFIGLILFKIMQKAYKEIYSPLAVIIAALLTYVLAENLGGSGVIAVTSLGLFFGNVYVKEKLTVLKIESVFTKALFVLIFMLTGVIIKIPLKKTFFISGAALLAIYYLTRFTAIEISMRKLTMKERIYTTLNAPKGIATAAIVFALSTFQMQGMGIVLDMVLAFILTTIIISSIITWLTPWFNETNNT
ncbi:hypothetical protein DRJ22_01935 [Candidatus Woesearchaeota archaeon]|nr:MAG: hypothetical protein DRJ22_01935 [Candidatus Woesearchaeota archaeon]